MTICSGIVYINDTIASGIMVRLYLRSSGELINEDETNYLGEFSIDTIYDEYHYALALYDDDTTNALIYDFIHP